MEPGCQTDPGQWALRSLCGEPPLTASQCLAGLLLGCGLVWMASGCSGSNRGAVGGTVTVNGEPLNEGQISFVPMDPALGPTAGATISNGQYQIDAVRGPVAGEYQVQIHAFRKAGKKIWDGMGDEKARPDQKNYVQELAPYLPAKYNDKSELRTTIVAGKVNIQDFHLRFDSMKR